MKGHFFAVVRVAGDDRARLSPRGVVDVARAASVCTKPPTAAQLRVLHALADGMRRGGSIPIRELGAAVDSTSSNNIYEHLRQLERRGLVTIVPRRARGAVITAAGWCLLAARKEAA